MTPADMTVEPDLAIYRGAVWEHTFLLESEDTGDPLDLTGLGPFVCQIKKINSETVIATATVTSAYDATGLITPKFTAVQTLLCTDNQVSCGIRDALNNLYAEGFLQVKKATPNPAS